MKADLFQYLLNVSKIRHVHFTECNDMYNIDFKGTMGKRKFLLYSFSADQYSSVSTEH